MVAAPVAPGPHVKALVGEFGEGDGAGHAGIVARGHAKGKARSHCCGACSDEPDDLVLAVALAVWGRAAMSALTPEADIGGAMLNVCF